jgi:nicotinamide mononucleotide transporter
MSAIEIVAAIFGLISVYLTIKRNIWLWPTGLIMVALYIIIFYQARLYSDVGLQIIYIYLQLYGWYYWVHTDIKKHELPISTLSFLSRFTWVVVIISGAFILGFIMNRYTNADYAYPDSFIVSASLVAQWLLARKVLENWIIWIVVDFVAVFVYSLKGLYPTTLLYLIFLFLAVKGFQTWQEDRKKQQA